MIVVIRAAGLEAAGAAPFWSGHIPHESLFGFFGDILASSAPSRRSSYSARGQNQDHGPQRPAGDRALERPDRFRGRRAETLKKRATVPLRSSGGPNRSD